jgi:hypothetical protein
MRSTVAFAALALGISLGFTLAACTTEGGGGSAVNLTPSDAATSMISGGAIAMRTTAASGHGDDPVILLTLSRSDGKTMTFEQANHAPHDVAVQSAGGALAQAMGLMAGTETPVLYHLRAGGNPFFCGADGPMNIGVYTDPAGAVTIVGLKSDFQVEDRAGGGFDIGPYSPDHVCARMHFAKG